ncbi:MAG: sigma-70 family RNA polymerase sigma factor [Chitinophagales bacterium]|nr:sigma-70 family RNA polymerase sigma factor [Chitinophagales bacterium]MCZ2393308.1 sigma-70 family RNA polymerase sigma factor [Chitinophagales bacterium]
MELEDAKLFQQFLLQETKKQAFEKIVRKYSPSLFGHLKKYINHREDIEDVLQIVWMKVWTSLHQFRGDSLLSTWLFTITTREAYNFYRSRKIKNEELLEGLQKYDTTIEHQYSMESSDIFKKLYEAIDTLPKKQKEVFMMRYFEEMTYNEMEHLTGTSIGALKASYHHAVKKIEYFINSI